jgi:cell wall-associated NlpC family hydrolase
MILTRRDFEERLVVDEARTWLGTPHRHRQMCKGAGIDCALFIMAAFSGAGLEDTFDPGYYTHDWHMHRSEELYLQEIEKYMGRIDDLAEPMAKRLADDPSFSLRPATVIMNRIGRTYSHGVIVTEWPNIIHSFFPSGIVEEVDIRGTPLMKDLSKIYSYWDKL